MLGIGIGGTPEKAMLLAKESLMAPVDIHELKARGPKNRAEELRLHARPGERGLESVRQRGGDAGQAGLGLGRGFDWIH